eukprot:SAG31_NODE_25887_length_452_cov_0.730878_1_plen_37_part_10
MDNINYTCIIRSIKFVVRFTASSKRSSVWADTACRNK